VQRQRSSIWPRVAAAATIVVVIGASAYVVWQRDAPAPLERQQVSPVPDPSSAVLALATASLDARNYRAALAYAQQILAVDATHAGAITVRDAARTALGRFDAAVADARKRLAAGDRRGAAQALEVARGIDATAPAVVEIASLLAEQTRQREREPVTRAALPSRPPEEPPRATDRVPAPSPAAKPQLPPPVVSAPSQPETQPASLPASSSAPATQGAALPPPATAPASKTAAAPPPAVAEPPPQKAASPPGPTREEDEAAIRRLAATYARAIENKDVALFRSIMPSLSREAERRLQEGFRAVTSQRVELRILSIGVRGDEASMVLRRRDTIQAGGQQRISDSEQRMTLGRTAGGWRILDIR
jgi:hypothetical protein